MYHMYTHTHTADKLKALFGQSGTTKTNAATTPLVYDQSYATMDPVPHNMHAGNSSIGSTVGHTPGRYLEHGLPEGAREWLCVNFDVNMYV